MLSAAIGTIRPMTNTATAEHLPVVREAAAVLDL